MSGKYLNTTVCAWNHPGWKVLKGERLRLEEENSRAVIVNKFGLVISETFAFNFPDDELNRMAHEGRTLLVDEVRENCYRAIFTVPETVPCVQMWNAR